MSSAAEILNKAPPWLLRPLPVNARVVPELMSEIERQGNSLPRGLASLCNTLDQVQTFLEYDAASNLAAAYVWEALPKFNAGLHVVDPTLHSRRDLVGFAIRHLVPKARAYVLRRLSKDPDWAVRRDVFRGLEDLRVHEVALPREPDQNWDTSGWSYGLDPGSLSRHVEGVRLRDRHGLPAIKNLAELRQILGISTSRQLGWLLLASDVNNGPYVKFTIPKQSGAPRTICAPKWQLLRVQRRILQDILYKIPVHPAAHGFVPGRSTVTNAERHQRANVIIKFDLEDFFPTIHHYRTMGLFASLGYAVGNARFSTDDSSFQVAPTLARLCTYTPEPQRFAFGTLPQGAPTSPAISNLVCRSLDARLEGLAARFAGTYTRYADDLTFSFADSSVQAGRLRWWVDQICHQEGFFLNQAKFRVIRKSQRQIVTGIVVNDSLHVPRSERRRFRAILHNCRIHGVASQSNGPGFASYLRGFASYIHMVDPQEGSELLQQVKLLLGPDEPLEGELP